MICHATVVAKPLLHDAYSAMRFSSYATFHSATCDGVADARRSHRVTPYSVSYAILFAMSRAS